MAAKTKTKSQKQVRFLLSSGSPLSPPAQNKLKRELHTGAVKITAKPKSKKK